MRFLTNGLKGREPMLIDPAKAAEVEVLHQSALRRAAEEEQQGQRVGPARRPVSLHRTARPTQRPADPLAPRLHRPRRHRTP